MDVLDRNSSLSSLSSDKTCVELPQESKDFEFYPMEVDVHQLPPLPKSMPRHRSLYSRVSVDESDYGTIPRLAPNPSSPTPLEHQEHVAFCRLILTPAQVLEMQGQNLFRTIYENRMARYARHVTRFSPTTAFYPTSPLLGGSRPRLPLSDESSFDVVFDRFNQDHLMEQLFKTKSNRDAFKRRKREVSDGIERKCLGIKSVRNELFREECRLRHQLALTDPSKSMELEVHSRHYSLRKEWQEFIMLTQRLNLKQEPDRRTRIGRERRMQLEQAWKEGKGPSGSKPLLSSPLRHEFIQEPLTPKLRKASHGLRLVISPQTSQGLDSPWSDDLLSPVDFLPDHEMDPLRLMIPNNDVDETGERHVGAAEIGDLSQPNSPVLPKRTLEKSPSPLKKRLAPEKAAPEKSPKMGRESPSKASPSKSVEKSPLKVIRQNWRTRVVGWFFATGHN